MEDEVEHAENQDERENLLRLFCWIVPFSRISTPERTARVDRRGP